jgi:hypothetical protein
MILNLYRLAPELSATVHRHVSCMLSLKVIDLLLQSISHHAFTRSTATRLDR